MVFAAVALLASQFTQARRTAAGVTAGLLLVFIVLDMVHRVVPNTVWLSQLSPVYYFNLSKPLIAGYSANLGAMVVLLALSVILSGAAVWLFPRRDIGGIVAGPRFLQFSRGSSRPRRAIVQGAWSLRSVYARSLAMAAAPTAWRSMRGPWPRPPSPWFHSGCSWPRSATCYRAGCARRWRLDS